MNPTLDSIYNIEHDGFAIIDDVFTEEEIGALIEQIELADQSNLTFRKTDDLFAIRQFLKEVPTIKDTVFNDKMRAIIADLFGDDYFIVKSIYFDKPQKSNWFVAWHQDLTIAVDKKIAIPDYGPWTVKLDKFAVQPPVNILQNNFTIRIHLDDTDEGNGALKVIPGSHDKVHRFESLALQSETICSMKVGGVMIIRPLLMHSSARSTTNNRRRVIHIEFSKAELPQEISWAEKEFY